MELLVCTSLDWYAWHLFSQWLLNWREYPQLSSAQTLLLSSHTHTCTHTHTFPRPWINLPCFHLWENLNPQQGAHHPFWRTHTKKDITYKKKTKNITDKKNTKKYYMKITCWIWEQAPPYCMALPDRYFIFALNLPVNQQRPVIRKSKKALGVCNEQKCHTLEHGEKTLRNCGSLTKLTVTSTPPSRPRVAS